MKKLKMVSVDWVDSNIMHGWASEEEARLDGLPEVHSVGFLFSRDDEKIILIMGYSEYGALIERKAIPMGCIKSIKKLRVESSIFEH